MTIRPISVEDLPKLQAAAEADGHVVIAATHIVEKGGEAVGYVSAGGIPMVGLWMDTKKTDMFDAKKVQREYETFFRFQGHQAIVVPCMVSSPFYPFMEKDGHSKLCDTTLFVKNLVKKG